MKICSLIFLLAATNYAHSEDNIDKVLEKARTLHPGEASCEGELCSKLHLRGKVSANFTDIQKLDLQGLWKSNCIQSQINRDSGYVLESFSFEGSRSIEFERKWYENKDCTGKSFKTDLERGEISILKRYNNNDSAIQNPNNTYKTQMKFRNKKLEKGLLWIDSSKSKLRMARGLMNGVQNTMLGLTEYEKVAQNK